MTWRLGVDSGGTFTDVCLFDEDSGQLKVWKVSSTPGDPSEGIERGVAETLAANGGKPEALSFFGHGTTVGTNALIQHKGALTGLITTEGFRDLLEIGRQKRPALYDIQVEKPQILVAREHRIGVPERMLHDGRIDTPLDEEAVRQAARTLRDAGVSTIAICFLYGFVYPNHERIAKRIVAEEYPEAFVTTSHEVAPEFREYERLSTTVVNSYLGPIMHRYIERLSARLTTLGIRTPLHLTQSNGGVIGFDTAAQFPVRTVLSGPSTGVVAAQAIGRQVGIDKLITFDMGGTSSDVSLLKDGMAQTTGESVIHGYPIKAPMLDIHAVGAGGGSIAYVDNGGWLKVGPQSAGAFPGPVCYDKGNEHPTVTDANVVLQTLNPTHLLNGQLPIRRDLAIAALEKLGGPLGQTAFEAAQGIIAVVTANMARAIRVISVQRGYDPREYALMAFGGAGPLHAARLARELGMTKAIIPLTPGTLCALGLLLTDLRADFAVTRTLPLAQQSLETANAALADLAQRAQAWFDAEGIAPPDQASRLTVDMRYKGQNYELSVPVPEGGLTEASLSLLAEGFEAEHKRAYGFTAEGEDIQMVTFRVQATGQARKASFPAQADAGPDASAAIIGTRDVWMPEAGGQIACPVYAREKLRAGNRFAGPAIVEQFDTTTVVLPGMTAHVEPHLNLVLEFTP